MRSCSLEKPSETARACSFGHRWPAFDSLHILSWISECSRACADCQLLSRRLIKPHIPGLDALPHSHVKHSHAEATKAEICILQVVFMFTADHRQCSCVCLSGIPFTQWCISVQTDRWRVESICWCSTPHPATSLSAAVSPAHYHTWHRQESCLCLHADCWKCCQN